MIRNEGTQMTENKNLLPYFKEKNGETCHPKRYENTIALIVYFYGEMSDTEKETAKKLVHANSKSMFEETAELVRAPVK